jgi:hypothetical protein
MPGVARGHRHACRLSNRRDECVVEWRMIWYPVAGKDPGGRKIERQDPICEGGQDLTVEPSTQDRALSGVGSLLGDDAPFDLADGEGRDELVCDRDGDRPGFDQRITAPYPESGHDIGVQDVPHRCDATSLALRLTVGQFGR